MRDGLEPRRNLLVRLPQELDHVANDVLVATVEECSGDTSITSTTSTTDTVDVIVNVGGKIIVDDMHDIGDVETTSGHRGSDHDRSATLTESIKRRLTLALSTITVDRSSGEVVGEQEVGQHVGHTLGLDEDESKTRILGAEKIEKDGALVGILDILDLLGDVLGSGSNTTDGKEDVLLQEVLGKHLDVPGEGGGEHERLALVNTGHVFLLDNSADLRLETHVQHAVSFIEDEVANVGETDTTALDEIDETTRRGAEKIAAALDLAKLAVDIGTTVDDGGADPGAIGELAGLVMDLVDEFTSRRENECSRVRLAAPGVGGCRLRGRGTGPARERRRKDGEQKATSLSGTGLPK